MDWFSKNFPTLAKLISTLGKTTQRPSGARKQTARRRTTRSTTDDARQAADTAVSNLADGPLPVTEGTEHVDPVQSEEVSPDLAPSRIDLDVPTPVAEEATPPISAEQATPVAGGATPSISAGMATPVAGEATPSIFAGEFTPVPAAASPSIFPGELDERPAGREEPTTRPTETGKPIVSDSVDTAQSTSMAQMYNTWVELGETITSARAEMHNSSDQQEASRGAARGSPGDDGAG